jgi:hypothetical protein
LAADVMADVSSVTDSDGSVLIVDFFTTPLRGGEEASPSSQLSNILRDASIPSFICGLIQKELLDSLNVTRVFF